MDVAGCHGCHCSVLWLGGHFFFTLITQKLVFAIWGLCWYKFQETSCHTASPTYQIICRISSDFLLAISDAKRDEKETDEKERDRDMEAI